MKIFFRFLLLVLVLKNSVFANDFRDVHQISLKKDETKKILVKYDTRERLIKLRWTLFTNGGLVVHRSYDKIIAQNMLFLNHKNQSFRLELKPRGNNYYNVPYLLVKFKKYDYEKNEAVLEILLSDDRSQLELQYLKNS